MSSPSPRSFRSRMGSAVRKTSSILSIARPGTPSVHSDSGSVKHLDAPSQLVLPPAPPAEHAAPSPIPESPAREAAESSAPAPVPTGPSPLAQTIVHDEPDDMHPHEARPASVVEEVAKPDEAPKLEDAPIEVPKVDEAPPTTEVAVEDSRVEEAPESTKHDPQSMKQLQPLPGLMATLKRRTVSLQRQTSPLFTPKSSTQQSCPTTNPSCPLPTACGRVHDQLLLRRQARDSVGQGRARRGGRAIVQPDHPRPNVTHEEESQTFSVMPVPQPHEVPVTMPSYDLDPTQSVWGHSTDASSDYGKTASSNGDALAHEPAPSVRMPAEDPFADPVPPITITAEENVFHPSMPEPQVHKEAPQAEETPVVVMPFPEIQDVIPQRSIRTVPSMQSWGPNTRPKSLIQTKHDLYCLRRQLPETDPTSTLLTQPVSTFPLSLVSPRRIGRTIVAPSARAWVA
ncbi:hypothetical protein BDZ89DRAFT_680061 [Hymenopellis radicata]|nr:hypothetical protein BDZ89DRAFT_680061 [Hymenopellis radicata]